MNLQTAFSDQLMYYRKNASSLIFATVLAGTVLLGTQGCSNSSSPQSIEPVPPAFSEPPAGDEDYSLLRANGTKWLNQKGEKVSLRGVNIGNWLSMELWMFDSGDNPLGENIPDQCTLESVLTERFGEAEKDRILKLHRDTWFQASDWDLIKEAGFNLVRIPFNYNVIEDDDAPMTVKDDAWTYLDWAISEAKSRDMYVILDLHGAVGGQGVEQHTGCANQNALWGNDTYQARTRWLWQQIAERYKDESAVAAYGLLNEPWGTDSETLKSVLIDLYQGVREVDTKHIVLLHGHNADGIAFYGDPLDDGMENVAFEQHFYPGLFGWGEIGYQVHRDWLTCGEIGDSGVCDWAKQAREAFTPMLIGEMQPWNGLGELGGPITRATFDKYNELNWAGTAWSYKNATAAGGLGNGRWGLVTNAGDQLLVKAQTWACRGWESTFADACDVSAQSTVPYVGTGSQTMYLVIKTGGFGGSLDVMYDSIQLIKDSDGTNLISGGEFGAGSEAQWTELALWGDPRTYTFDHEPGEFAGSDSGAALRITSGNSHSLIYQAVEIEGGESYTVSGKFKDNASQDTWAEVYLIPYMPREFEDVTGRALPPVDLNNSDIAEIETFFSYFDAENMGYVVNQSVVDAMTASEPASIFTNIPSQPSDLMLNVAAESVALSWVAAVGDVTGYKVYRSTAPRSGFGEIASVTNTDYVDDTIEADTTYYYYVAAYNDVDEGYGSDIVASGETFYTVPTLIQAENYTAAHPGVNTEGASDAGGGFNIGSFEPGRWAEYEISVPEAKTYAVDFRLASLPGDVRFQVRIGDEVLDEITVPATGGWQDYVTLERSIDLPAGRSTLRLYSVDNQWNLNWFEIKD